MFTLLTKRQNPSNLSLKINTYSLDQESSDSFGKNIKNFLQKDSSHTTYILSHNDMLENENIIDLLSLKQHGEQISFIKATNDLNIEDLEIQDLVKLVNEEKISLPNYICASKEILLKANIETCRTYEEIALKLIFFTVLNLETSLVLEDDNLKNLSFCPDKNTRAKALRYLIANANIEDLFPNNSWQNYSFETAAMSYHVLCAMFIKFDDLISAKECLKLSANFEDSPRGLALKGIIALRENEDLSAVANMVSSLHIYEKRKKEDNHLENFRPQSFDIISSRLNDGLSALNKRENKEAAKYFLDAILDFDNFFKEQGLEA